MRFKIGYETNGIEDYVVIEGDTVADIREKADAHLERVGGVNPWSQELP